jgi:hypothetical protein
MKDEADLFQSRARALGISPRTLAARTRRSLASARKTLEALARPYADIDNSVESNLQPLLREFDEFEASITETVKWLEEPLGS